MVGWFREEGLVSDDDPNVSAGENSGNPHYLPTAAAHRAIRADEILLLDLWGKLERPGAVFADITWMGYTGSNRSRAVRARRSRPSAARAMPPWISCSRRCGPAGICAGGKSIGPRPRSCTPPATAIAILHRTGHSLGESVHGNGVNMDDYETHDDRRLLPGTGFTIEPGVYFDDFGVRTEINMIVSTRDAAVTGPLQTGILALV